MRHWFLVVPLLSVALFVPTPAAAQAPDAKRIPGPNAALKYWQAFAFLPTLDKDQEKLLQDWNTVPLDAAALKLIDKYRTCRPYLHRGAKLRHCDWSPDYEDGIRMLLPHLVRSMTLARLAALSARHEFGQGHGKAGWEEVMAMLALGRHAEVGPSMIGKLVGYRIESMAIDAAAPHLPELKATLPEAAAAALDALPAGPTLPQLVREEKETGAAWLIRELKEAERQKAGSWRDVWKELLSAPGEGDVVDPNLAKSAQTYEQAIKLIEDVLPYYDELAKVLELPWKDFDTQYPDFVKKSKAANPLAPYLLPNLDKIIPADRRARAQLALFKAAVAVVQGGPDKLKDVPDPFGDGPFDYKALDKGFELKSKLIFRGQPVTLTVGQVKKE
jgi:hypothetical protein